MFCMFGSMPLMGLREVYPKSCETSKAEPFPKHVNGFQQKNQSQVIDRVLNTLSSTFLCFCQSVACSVLHVLKVRNKHTRMSSDIIFLTASLHVLVTITKN